MAHRQIIIISIFSFTVGSLITGYFTQNYFSKNRIQKQEIHTGREGFINPLIDCNSWTDALPPKANQMKDKLFAYIENSNKSGNTESISLFFRDLNNGPQFDIESDEKFAAASLLKVPILIYYFKLVETTAPDILKQKIKFDKSTIQSSYAVQLINPPPELIDGQEYAVDELLSRMITFSDNVSTELLLKHRPELNIPQMLLDMGISLELTGGDYWITVRSYASLFRILYNATFLNKVNSQAALQLLSFTNYNEGLRAGVPAGVTISSKFGEREFNTSSQLHDCGIVYHPSRPYILCIMTRGQNLDILTRTLKEISAIVHSEVN